MGSAARLTAVPAVASIGEPVAFDGSGSSDADGTIVDYAFDFGDGTSEAGASALRGHAFRGLGAYEVTLVVTDDDGATSTATVLVHVAAPATGPNWKPLVALLFAAILLLVDAWGAERRPWRGRRDRRGTALAFGATALPFVVAEAAAGVVSWLTGALSVPPIWGIGMAVDAAILAAGLVVCGVRAARM